MALRYLHAFGFSAPVHRFLWIAKNPVPRLQGDTRELNSVCACRTSSTERPETSSSFDGRSINANHGPIRASRATALSGYARGHRVYMGTGRRRIASRTHRTLILTLEPGSSLMLNRTALTVARFTAGLRLVPLDSIFSDRRTLLSSTD